MSVMSPSEESRTVPWTSQFVDINGIKTHYLTTGPAGAPVVLFVHGGGAGADSIGNWQHIVPQFAIDFRVIAVDMIGFGRTAKPPGPDSYSQTARNFHLATFVRALDLSRVSFVGNSMGGATALGVAMEHPELVDHLILMGSAGLNSEITEALKPIIFYDYTIAGMRKMVEALTGPNFEIPENIIERRYELSVEPDTRRAYTATMEWIRDQGGLFYPEEAISQVKTPTLVINGKDDLVVPLQNAYRFLDLLPNSWGYIIPHCGHWAMIEAPEHFTAAARHFLKAEIGNDVNEQNQHPVG